MACLPSACGTPRTSRIFHQPIGEWNTINGSDYGFAIATSFNQLIGLWITANVIDILSVGLIKGGRQESQLIPSGIFR